MSISSVEKQYTNWVYPLPIDDMRAAIADGYNELGCPSALWPMFWPRRRQLPPLDILVAGCGTNQAAYHACRNPNHRVLGIDLSEASISHQRALKEKHDLKNLELIRMDLTQVAKLGRDFDYITSTGVLHHLPDPDAGLAALRDVLRPQGVINIMLYGSSLRLGVYVLQDAFRTLGLSQTVEDLNVVKSTIKSLPPDHVARRYIKVASDLAYDAGIVDTFLHTQDKAYWVRDIFNFVRRSGLEFLSWIDPLDYDLSQVVHKDHELWPFLDRLDDEKKAHFCDLICLDRGTHRFVACHPSHKIDSMIPFSSDELLFCTAAPRTDLKVLLSADHSAKVGALCERRGRRFNLPWELSAVLEKLTAHNNIGGVIDGIFNNIEDKKMLKKRIIEQFEAYYKQGHIHIFL